MWVLTLSAVAVFLPSTSSFRLQHQKCSMITSNIVLKGALQNDHVETDTVSKRKSLLSKRITSIVAEKAELPPAVHSTLKYDGMMVVDLREMLRERGLHVSGVKDVLKMRLAADDYVSGDGDDSDSDDDVIPQEVPEFNGILDDESASPTWVKSSIETAYNDRKFRDQRIQEEQKTIVCLLSCS
jgi:SAP domain